MPNDAVRMQHIIEKRVATASKVIYDDIFPISGGSAFYIRSSLSDSSMGGEGLNQMLKLFDPTFVAEKARGVLAGLRLVAPFKKDLDRLSYFHGVASI